MFYIRGGFSNIRGATPPIQNPNYPNPAGLTADELKTIAKVKSGDDDHPAYTDRQISEAMNAEVVNAIAGDPELWSQSAIVITYDESDGFYDHVPPRILSYGPDGLPLARGVRVPLMLISPYARAHAVSHAEGDHNAVIETINAIFGLPPLSQLPDEAAALKAGDSPAFNAFAPEGFHQKYLGPARHELADHRQPAFRLQPEAPARRGAAVARRIRADAERRAVAPAPLRRPRLRGDRRDAGGSPPGHRRAAAGELQHAAGDAAGLQLRPGACRGCRGRRPRARWRRWRASAPRAAGPTLDRVRAERAIRCGAVARPGLLEQTAQRRPRGCWSTSAARSASPRRDRRSRSAMSVYDFGRELRRQRAPGATTSSSPAAARSSPRSSPASSSPGRRPSTRRSR